MTEMLALRSGTEVTAHGRRYRLERVLNLEAVLAIDLDDNTAHELRIRDLDAVPSPAELIDRAPHPDPYTVDEVAWQVAQQRFDILQPLLQAESRTAEQVQCQAAKAGVHWVTVYRWLEQYESAGQRSALLPRQREGGRGKSRLVPEVDALIKTTIDEHYLTVQKPSFKDTHEEIRRRCRDAGLPLPSLKAIRARIDQVTDKERRRRRGQRRQAQALYRPLQGSFPNAEWPLAVVQIDHTPCDVLVVDDVDRLPIGRPWITLAIDVFSRMVAGFYITLDRPSAFSVGLCLSHAILPKDAWLAKLNVDTPWPLWGLMDVVHADNAKEFRGKMLQRACEDYGIDLHWRPVARPHFGGHIERLCGTLNQALHTLPGSTFSNPTERGEYPAEAKAALTLGELERWLAVYLTQVYHQRLHKGIGLPPLKKYEQGVFGDGRHPGRGLPPRPTDPDRIRLEFLPYLERTVQPYGLQIDSIVYYHDILKPWLNAAEPGTRGVRRTFIVRRDPRDISVVYFYDPELKQYFEIPYRNTTHPPISVWELREVRRKLREQGQRAVNEEVIFDAYRRLRRLEAEAVRETKKVRRAAQRRRHRVPHQRPPVTPTTRDSDVPDEPLEDITPFDEIIELDDGYG